MFLPTLFITQECRDKLCTTVYKQTYMCIISHFIIFRKCMIKPTKYQVLGKDSDQRGYLSTLSDLNLVAKNLDSSCQQQRLRSAWASAGMIQSLGSMNRQFHWFLFVLILYIPVNNFSVMSGRVFLGGTSTKQWIKCLAQGHNIVTPPAVTLEPATLRSPV